MELNIKKFFLFSSAFFFFSCQTTVVEEGEVVDIPKERHELITPNIIKVYSKNGNLISEGKVRTDCDNNWCSQAVVEKISNSKVKSFLKDKQGRWKEYTYKVGKIFVKKEGIYKKNQKQGVWKEYIQKKTRGGNWANVLLKRITYEDDKRNGPWKQYREKGQVLKSGNYINGLKENKEYKYSLYNREIELKTYLNGKLNGSYWKKNSNTNKYAIKGFYKDSLKDSTWTHYYGNGRIKKTLFYQNGELNGLEKNYYSNGNLQSEGENLNNHKINIWKFYYPNGVKKSEGEYKYSVDKQKSLRIGVWKEYYNNRRLFAEGTRDDKRIGKWIFYFSGRQNQKAYEGEMSDEFEMSEGTIYSEDGLILGKGRLRYSVFRLSSDGRYLKTDYKPGSPFVYYRNGKKDFEVLSDNIAVQYDSRGRKFAEGPVIPTSLKRNGCWSFVNGSKRFYVNGRESKKAGREQNCK